MEEVVGARRPAEPPPPQIEPSAAPPPEPERTAELAPREPPSGTPPAPRSYVPRAGGRARPELDLEDLVGGRLLAWVGGVAIVLGIVFFLVMAVSRGWIDEPTRVVLAFVGSTLLLATGVYLYERRGETDAALAAVASSLAGLFASDTTATQVYDLVSPATGLAIAALIGGTGAAVAVRWDSRVVGSLGILGALVSPVLVDAGTEGVTLAFMAIALASAVAILVWRRWDWLAVAAFVVSVPQLLVWVDDTYRDRLGATLVVLALFWAIYVVGAIGYELRAPTGKLRPSSGSLLLANALLVSGVGYALLRDTGHESAGTAWVIGVALAHLGLGAGSLRGRIGREIALLLLAVAVGLSAVAVALALDGPVLVAAWSVEAVLLTWLGARTGYQRSYLAAAVFLVLAAAHVIFVEAPPADAVDGIGGGEATAVVGVVLVAAGAFLMARLYRGDAEAPVPALDAVAVVGAAYLPVIVFDGAVLVVAWAVTSVALAWLGRRFAHVVATVSAPYVLGVAAVYAVAHEAPPVALRDGVDDLTSAALAVAAVVAGALLLRALAADPVREYRPALETAVAVGSVYLPSIAIVDVTGSGSAEAGQTPQVLLSAFWGVTGLGSIVYGLVRDDARFRLGGLALLGLAVAKVFLYDLSELDEIYRVLSFIVLGLLLLAGAYSYARVRRETRRTGE